MKNNYFLLYNYNNNIEMPKKVGPKKKTMRGKGVGSTIKKIAGKVNEFLKKHRVVSRGLDFVNEVYPNQYASEGAKIARTYGYGKRKGARKGKRMCGGAMSNVVGASRVRF